MFYIVYNDIFKYVKCKKILKIGCWGGSCYGYWNLYFKLEKMDNFIKFEFIIRYCLLK